MADRGAVLAREAPSTHRGLTSAEAARRLAHVGPNLPTQRHDEGLWEELAESLREPLVLLLIGVGVLYAVLGEFRDAGIILAVIVTVSIAETWTEWRAGRAIASLSKLAAPQASVWRDDAVVALPSEELVPGDVVALVAGSRVPADLRLIESAELAADESLVTGEAEAVERAATAGNDRLLAGSLIVRGRGTAEVTETGPRSTLGRIAQMVAETKEPRTPLQRQMGELAKVLLIVALAVSVLVPVVGVLSGRPPREMLLTGLTLAFATIPEELPILIVVVLGLGSLRLARRGAIVRRLVAAETLGATTIICTDKTGTLTQNRMRLAGIRTAAEILDGDASDSDRELVVRAARLASERASSGGLIDALDAALSEDDPHVEVTADRYHPFDTRRRLASGLQVRGDVAIVGVKGAPEAVVARCTRWRSPDGMRPLDGQTRSRFLAQAARWGSEGRVIAAASGELPTLASDDRDAAESELILEGLLLFVDPVRAEVPAAISEVHSAGISVSVITGDQETTAHSVAVQAGLPVAASATGADLSTWSDSEIVAAAHRGAVFARAQPEDKLRIVRALTASGDVVAVTGDGVNDAPALRAAAIGVAMGRSGSDVAREASDLVLTDDNFATIARAVAEGRRLYDNLRKAVRFYLAVKVALVLVSLGAALAHNELPFAPVQIVILELFMDLGASLAFVNQPAEGDIMRRRPRDPNARFLDASMARGIVTGGALLAALTGGCFMVALLSLSGASARTVALVAWLVGYSLLGAVMASERQPLAIRNLRNNPSLLGWIAASWLFAFVLLTVAPLRDALHAGPLSLTGALSTWLVAVAAPLALDATRRFRRQGRP